MKFIDNINELEYVEFCKKNNAHFLQTYAWGNVNKLSRDLTPCYVGLVDDGKLVAATLLLKKKTPFNMAYFYAPRGFVMNMKDKEVLTEFTNKLKEYLKKENGIYLRVNPDMKYQDIDSEAKPIPNGNNNYELLKNMVDLGYIHQGFYKLHKGNEPRYTFRIDLTSDFNTIDSRMNKTFIKTVRKSYDYDLIIQESDDINTFYNLIKKNAEKDNFKSYPLNFYTNLFQEFKKYKQIKIFEAIVKPQKVLQKLNIECQTLTEKLNKNPKNKVDIENMLNRCEKDIEIFNEHKNTKDLVICSLICVYSGDKAWTLYIGNNSLGTKTNAVNRLYYEAIKDAKVNNYRIMDLFGTVGDPHTSFKNMAGIHEFKRKMGGEYIEFIGEFDLVNKKFMYKILPILLKIYRKIRG